MHPGAALWGISTLHTFILHPETPNDEHDYYFLFAGKKTKPQEVNNIKQKVKHASFYGWE